MVDRRFGANEVDESRARPRWGSLANESSLLELLEGGSARLQPTALTLTSVNANIYSRRHSAHSCPMTEEKMSPLPPPVPLRPPAVPKRNFAPPAIPPNRQQPKHAPPPPHIPPAPARNRIPPVPPARRSNPNSPNPNYHSSKMSNKSAKQAANKPVACAFEFSSKLAQEYILPPPPSAAAAAVSAATIPSIGPPPSHTAKSHYRTNVKPNQNTKVSIRQDSSVSSDSFSQTSSPSYTTKTMETPLLPPRTPPFKQNGVAHKAHKQMADVDDGNQTIITKSASTPASLQTIVRFQNGSNMSLHHRIIKDIRRPSSHYVPRARLRFRFAQLVLNAFALLAIGGGMVAYFKAYPLEVHIVNNATANASSVAPIIIYEKPMANPAPGICLPVIVSFCQQHKLSYNFTIFPNFMGHFGQPEAQQELEVYDALVDVRCYELSALFLCSIFVPKCGPSGALVGPCRSLCYETKQRCSFFLNVFGLELPDYLLRCDYFPENPDPDVCIGHLEVKESRIRASRPVCLTGFQCDGRRCIPKDWQCDGHIDCQDQTDETNCNKCGAGMINCGGDKCMSQEHMCDGEIDCPWAQDERNCLRLSEQNGDEGHGQLEVFRPGQKQWVPACVRHWDPATTADHICSLLGYSNSSESHWRGHDHTDVLPIHETTTKWRMHQAKQSKNMIRDFGACRGKAYPTVEITCTNYMCGKTRKTYAERRVKRIVGGTPSKPGDWPFLAAILGGPAEIFYCAGVLIADQWVLTASHCVGNHSDVSGWTIQLGITRRHSHSFYGQKVSVKRVVPHPKYNLGIAHDNDVALFQLSSRVTFHEHLLPVCLPPANKELRPGTVCTVIGWGKKEDTGLSEYSPEINEVEVPVLNRELCNKWLENRELNVTDGMICAGYQEGGKDACQGDSGGPLLCRDEKDRDRWFVGGIVSWGIKCAHPHLPGVYAYVPKYIPWILEQMQNYTD